MKLRVLHYFLTIAREGSLIGAAKALNLTQPTLSRQMKELEDELGQKLLIRSAQGMLLTSEGLILRKRAEEIMELVEKQITARKVITASSIRNAIKACLAMSGSTNAVMHLTAIAPPFAVISTAATPKT